MRAAVRRVSLAVVALPALLASACFPYALPPGQASFGFARDVDAHETLARLSAGVHTASIPRLVEKPLDFGVGVMADLYSSKNGETSKSRTHGFYADAARFVYRRDFFRASAGVRGEMLFDDGVIGWGALARGAAELFRETHYAPDGNNGPCALHGGAGAAAIGVYVETGYEGLPGGVPAFVSTAGFTFRWPFVYGMLVYGCGDD